MIDLNRPKTEKKHEPDGVELAALVIVIAVWVYMIIGAML